jgi:lipopolysaccharide cholinephosphotransferase
MKEKIKFFSEEELAIRNEGLVIIKEGLDKLNIDFFFMMGILLGAVREKDFIKWDWDVELGSFTEKVIDRVNEIKEIFSGTLIDFELVDKTFNNFKINFFYRKNKYTLWGLYEKDDFLYRGLYLFPKKYFSYLEEIEFRGEIYKTPNNSKDFLSYAYGDWKTIKKTTNKKVYLNERMFRKRSLFNKVINKIKVKIGLPGV